MLAQARAADAARRDERAGADLGHAGARRHHDLPVAVPVAARRRQLAAGHARASTPSRTTPGSPTAPPPSPSWSTLVVWQSVPFAALTLYAGLTTVPAELYESARIDGATRPAGLPLRHLPDPAPAVRADHLAGGDLGLQVLRADLGDQPGRTRTTPPPPCPSTPSRSRSRCTSTTSARRSPRSPC